MKYRNGILLGLAVGSFALYRYLLHRSRPSDADGWRVLPLPEATDVADSEGDMADGGFASGHRLLSEDWSDRDRRNRLLGSNTYQIRIGIRTDGFLFTTNLLGFVGVIDWGDGVSESFDCPSCRPSHTYAVAGSYRLSARGTCTGLSYLDEEQVAVYLESAACITELNHIGVRMGIRTMKGAFADCVNLTQLPYGILDGCFRVADFDFAFAGCSALCFIPDNLFAPCAAAESMIATFYGCSALQSLHNKLLGPKPLVLSFRSLFEGCSSLGTIPSKLFSQAPKVRDFGSAFSRCASLRRVPTQLFEFNTEAEFFDETFSGCMSLEKIMPHAFCHCRKAIDFTRTFDGCINLSAESPYTLLPTSDGKSVKVHLYERNSYPDEFAAVEGTGCFTHAEMLKDFASIPVEWKTNSVSDFEPSQT